MARMVESSAADQHQIIIIEQTPLADLLMKRIMYGSNLSGIYSFVPMHSACFYWSLN